MHLLAIDTAGTTGSVALAELDANGSWATIGSLQISARTFSVRLIPAITELLQPHCLPLSKVDALVVVSGPGSFTGMRVGLGAVKGMAEATGKPIIALSRLAVMASMLPQAEQAHAILDAGRGEFYSGIYRDTGWECVRESLETAAMLPKLLNNASICAAEDSIFAALSPLASITPFASITLVHPTAADAFSLAVRCWQQRMFADVATLDANYLRRSDVELFAKSTQSAVLPQTV